MKKSFSILIVLILAAFLTTTVLAATTATPGQVIELGELKICKAGGSSVTRGQLFTFRVGSTEYRVPAGYCVLAGQYALNTELAIQETIPAAYYVSAINVRPGSRSVSQDLATGSAVIRIGSGVTEVIYTNWLVGVPTSTPRPTNTPSTNTPQPVGRLQICKAAVDPGVAGNFTFRFDARSFNIPVGACSVLLFVNVGTLTITEDPRSGYTLADIYTIPASRLISTDLNGRSATVRIVEGTVASQTIVVFRNRSVAVTATFTHTATQTPSHTPTATSTPSTTGTPSFCVPEVIYATFNNVVVGESVEGEGKVAPYLNIDANNGTAVSVRQATEPMIYLSPNDSGDVNGGLIADGGFSDLTAKQDEKAHKYTFTFAPGMTITSFSLHMMDYGDLNPSRDTSHYVSMTAYNASGDVVSKEELSYTTPALTTPRSSDQYGDLYFNGDASSAPAGQPGNWMWNVFGSGIVKVVLEFGAGYDPNIAFDHLSFTRECARCQSFYSADFQSLPVGESVEGPGKAAPYLNIDSRGTAVRVVQAIEPMVYLASNNAGIVNGGLAADGGFSDVVLKEALQPHLYTFTFDQGVTITNFSLHMLDYGDLNPSLATSHNVSMTAYDASGQVISKKELNYTTPPKRNPRSSDLYGDLYFNGDAVSARAGQPGNWTGYVFGNGIVKVVLEFGAGYDPNIAFDQLYFTIACE